MVAIPTLYEIKCRRHGLKELHELFESAHQMGEESQIQSARKLAMRTQPVDD